MAINIIDHLDRIDECVDALHSISRLSSKSDNPITDSLYFVYRELKACVALLNAALSASQKEESE